MPLCTKSCNLCTCVTTDLCVEPFVAVEGEATPQIVMRTAARGTGVGDSGVGWKVQVKSIGFQSHAGESEMAGGSKCSRLRNVSFYPIKSTKQVQKKRTAFPVNID